MKSKNKRNSARSKGIRTAAFAAALAGGIGFATTHSAPSSVKGHKPKQAPASESSAVTTWHNDSERTGRYTHEIQLTQSVVNSSNFGLRFSQPVTGAIESQPLYMPSVSIGGVSHNIVVVATREDLIYAFDADSASNGNSSPLWSVNLGTPEPQSGFVSGNESTVGVLSTPVIDPKTNTVYVSDMAQIGGTGVYQLHALDLSTGKEKFSGPTTVKGSVGSVAFDPMNCYQRPGLLLLNSVVYITYGGLAGDPAPDRGWIFGYEAGNISKQTCVWTSAPDVTSGYAGGAIWMSGAAPSSDGTSIFVTSGNGDFNKNTGGHDYGDSILMLQPSGKTLAVKDYFTPSNESDLSSNDLDLGSSNPMLIPPQEGVASNTLVQFTKTNTIYQVKRETPMGEFNSTDKIFNEVTNSVTGGAWSAPVYLKGRVYIATNKGPLAGYYLTNGKLTGTPFKQTSTTFSRATPSISYNGSLTDISESAILWIIESTSNGAVLHAYNPFDLKEVFNSGTGANKAGKFIKWGVPTIANGKVYVPCDGELDVYGTATPPSIAQP